MKRIITIASLMAIPLFLTGCVWKRPTVKSTPSPTPSAVTTSQTQPVALAALNYLTVNPTEVAQAIATNQKAAEEKVKAWKSNAVLYHMTATLPANLAAGQATEVYTYGSPDDAYNWWTLTVSGKTGKSVRAIIPREDYLGTGLTAIPTQFWKINYVEAVQLAEAAGGSDYRSRHPEAVVTASLMVGEPKNYLWWIVEYQDVTGEVFKLFVNPSTKEVVNQSGVPVTTPS